MEEERICTFRFDGVALGTKEIYFFVKFDVPLNQ